jgi:hypothetical protein
MADVEGEEARVPADPPPPGAAGGPAKRERRTLLDRVDRIARRRPLRYLALEHDFHLLPYSVSHSKRARRAIVLLLVLLVGLSSWYWVIPRTDALLTVQYHEGLFNAIDIDARVDNRGTVALVSLHVELVVTVDGTGEAVGASNATRSLPAHSVLDLSAIAFKGDQITTNYRISVTARYLTGGEPTVKSFDFVTREPFMNFYFEAPLA